MAAGRSRDELNLNVLRRFDSDIQQVSGLPCLPPSLERCCFCRPKDPSTSQGHRPYTSNDGCLANPGTRTNLSNEAHARLNADFGQRCARGAL